MGKREGREAEADVRFGGERTRDAFCAADHEGDEAFAACTPAFEARREFAAADALAVGLECDDEGALWDGFGQAGGVFGFDFVALHVAREAVQVVAGDCAHFALFDAPLGDDEQFHPASGAASGTCRRRASIHKPSMSYRERVSAENTWTTMSTKSSSTQCPLGKPSTEIAFQPSLDKAASTPSAMLATWRSLWPVISTK